MDPTPQGRGEADILLIGGQVVQVRVLQDLVV